MRVFILTALLVLIIGNIGAVDTQSLQFIDHIRAISAPRAPEIINGGVLFTASSAFNRVGISFAHEGYSRVHWMQRMINPATGADSGIMFHVEPIPANIRNMDYRMIIGGLWTTNPLNPRTVTGPSGVMESRVPLPARPITDPENTPPGMFRFSFWAPPGEIVTVGGCFNGWDPFMFQLREESPGFYTLLLPLPPGSFQYVFFHRGEWVTDPKNPILRFGRDGRSVSEGFVR